MCSHINVGSGLDLTIKNLAKNIKEVVGYKGNIKFDSNKPDGVSRKLLNSDLINKLGFIPATSLKDGLRKTYKDFLKNYNF